MVCEDGLWFGARLRIGRRRRSSKSKTVFEDDLRKRRRSSKTAFESEDGLRRRPSKSRTVIEDESLQTYLLILLAEMWSKSPCLLELESKDPVSSLIIYFETAVVVPNLIEPSPFLTLFAALSREPLAAFFYLFSTTVSSRLLASQYLVLMSSTISSRPIF